MKIKDEAAERKQRSIAILKQRNIPYIEHLPVIETSDSVRIRGTEEIAKRAIACLLTIQLACDMAAGREDIQESKAFMQGLLERYGVADCLTGDEQELFTGSPSQQAVVNMSWRYEGYWVLLWTLGIVDELEYPSEICDCQFAIEAVSSCASLQAFLEKAKVRPINEILDQADLILRYDWACVDARINGRPAPQGMDAGVVVERHKALNWLIDAGQDDDWDHAPTDT